MNVLNKIVTAVKAGVTEAGEAIIDSQALRILDQEIREATEELDQSKDALASMIARQKLSDEKAEKIKASIDEHEGYAVKALEKGDEHLALDVATKIAKLENDLATETKAGESFTNNADALRSATALAEKDVQYMKSQVDTLRATENVQKAEAAVSQRHSGSNSKLRTAMESLERIKEKQALKSAQMSAAADMAMNRTEKSLDERLEDAGLKESHKADDVLERIKQQYR